MYKLYERLMCDGFIIPKDTLEHEAKSHLPVYIILRELITPEDASIFIDWAIAQYPLKELVYIVGQDRGGVMCKWATRLKDVVSGDAEWAKMGLMTSFYRDKHLECKELVFFKLRCAMALKVIHGQNS